MDLLRNLILVVTHRCNLKCSYCFIKKDNRSIELDIALKAISIFFHKNKDKDAQLYIKFFGGEPLLRFRLIKKIIEQIKSKEIGKYIQFGLTTNGTLLNDKIINFFKKFPSVEIQISFNRKRLFHFQRTTSNKKYLPLSANKKLAGLLELPNIGINLTISPRDVECLSDDLYYLFSIGFRKFNFLPVYFKKWTSIEQEILKSELSITSKLIRKLANSDEKNIEIKNVKTLSPTPLFNNGLVVDCNGDVFLNNLILSYHFAHLRKNLKIGNVNDPASINWKSKVDFNEIIKNNLDVKIYNTTLKVDNILTDFVKNLIE